MSCVDRSANTFRPRIPADTPNSDSPANRLCAHSSTMIICVRCSVGADGAARKWLMHRVFPVCPPTQ